MNHRLSLTIDAPPDVAQAMSANSFHVVDAVLESMNATASERGRRVVGRPQLMSVDSNPLGSYALTFEADTEASDE